MYEIGSKFCREPINRKNFCNDNCKKHIISLHEGKVPDAIISPNFEHMFDNKLERLFLEFYSFDSVVPFDHKIQFFLTKKEIF